MSSPSQIKRAQSFRDDWIPYVAPPLAASLSVVPVFFGFIAKSAQQVGKPIPKMTPLQACKEGMKASPITGTIIGLQMLAQNLVEKKLIPPESNQESSLASMVASSVIVGGVSAPGLAVLNGITRKRTIADTLKAFSCKQAAAIVSRETSFLFSLRFSDYASGKMKQVAGDNKVFEIGSVFLAVLQEAF